MEIKPPKIKKLYCYKCRHRWIRRNDRLPIQCPHCTSRIWWKKK